MTEAAPERIRARPWRVAAIALLALAGILIALLAGLYLDRRQIAREAVTHWLQSKGIASESQFQAVGPGRLVGRIRIGPAEAPDLTVDRAEVDYSLADLLAGRGVRVTSVKLVRPVLRASWRNGRFSAGSLDRLIEQFRKRPPAPGAPNPTVQIDQGRIELATDYGVLRATADALIQQGRLVRLDAESAPVLVAFERTELGLGVATLRARTVGDRLNISLRAPVLRARTPEAEVQGGLLTLTSEGSYPDLARADVAEGRASLEISAGTARAPAAAAQALRLAAVSAWGWTRGRGGDALWGDLRVSAGLQALAASDLRLASAAGEFSGDYVLGAQRSIRLTGQAQAKGGWSGLGAPGPGDSAEVAALKRGVADFTAAAEGVALAADRTGLHARLTAPVRLRPQRGGEIRLVPRGDGYRLTSGGGGLPTAEADIRQVAFANGGATAAGSVKAALSIGPLQQASFEAAGQLRVAGGAAAFRASRCVEVKAARLDLGANDVERIAGRVCPTGVPLLQLGKGGWRLAGRAEGVSATVPFLQAAVSDERGEVRLAQRGGGLSADVAVASAHVRDLAPSERFRPLVVSGAATLARNIWTGGFDARLPNGPTLVHARLRHDDRSGVGGVEFATPVLAFAKAALQPSQISDLGGALGTEVVGQARFTGGFHWTKAGATSAGELAVPSLGFMSPVGAVSGLSGDIRFTSLAPLIAPAGQTLHIARIGSALPVTNVAASLQLQAAGLTMTAEGAAGGGRLRLADLVVPLAKDQPVRGALQLTGVQLHDLVEASPFGDRVDLDAKVSGKIPFKTQGGKVTIEGGDLHAVVPGRLSIQRAALTSVSAQGSVQAPGAPAAAQAATSTDTFTDFAYQAMENLAFSTLDASVGTQPRGRLGVLFHIVGYHDPPKRQEITISWWDLIRRKFMGKKLPLPSGTGVDLTLDTSLNLDDLLKDYADFERLRSSPPVQR